MFTGSLVFAWGNPSRGDDALGPCFIERLETLAAVHPEWPPFETLTDFQLQIEHALDLGGRARILFVDASFTCNPPFAVSTITPVRDASFSTHALSPQALLQVYRDVTGLEPPPTQLLAIRGEGFELGEDLSNAARSHLDAALAWAAAWLDAEASSNQDVPAPGCRAKGWRVEFEP